MSGGPAIAAGKGGKVVGFKAGERCIEHFPARHDDDVQTGRDRVAPEHLARQPFGAVAFDGRSQFSRGRDAEPRGGAAIRHHEQHHEPSVDSRAGLVGALEFGPATDAARAPEALGH